MRYVMFFIVLCVGLIALAGRAQVATPQEKAFIDANLGKLIKVDPTPVQGEELAKVFHATFYMVKVSMGNTGTSEMLVAARVGDDLSDVSLPGGTADMPALLALVKSDFKLKTDGDGKAFEAALDLLYPPDTRYDEKRKAVRHAGTSWTFIRGMFIGDYKGLLVTTDADGTIMSIRYSREIK
jgi:hypothetical protein